MKCMRILLIISNIIISIWCWLTILLLIGLIVSYKMGNDWIISYIYPIYKKTLIVIFFMVTFRAIASAIEKRTIKNIEDMP